MNEKMQKGMLTTLGERAAVEKQKPRDKGKNKIVDGPRREQ